MPPDWLAAQKAESVKTLRSLLFIPGDSERKLAKAEGFWPDALILDLEDSVSAQNKVTARQLVSDFLRAHTERSRRELWVRINPLSDPAGLLDLVAVVMARPDGIVLPKADGPDVVRTLSTYLQALEMRDEIPAGSIRILPVATETARAPFNLAQYADLGDPRLLGLTWGAEDLSSAIGASTNKAADGDWDEPYRLVRSLCLLAAHAAEVQAIDTLYSDYKDLDGLRRTSTHAQRQGFTGRIAIHPDQIEIINDAFSPSLDDIAHARRVIAAFQANPGAGTIGLDGQMLDIPHLRQARRILASTGATEQAQT